MFFSRTLTTAASPAAPIWFCPMLRARRHGSDDVRIEFRYRLRERNSNHVWRSIAALTRVSAALCSSPELCRLQLHPQRRFRFDKGCGGEETGVMTSELNPATAFGSGIQITASGQSVHLLQVPQRRVLLQSFADCDCTCIADAVVLKAARAEIRE